MKTHDPQNERTKRRYLTFLKEARRRSEASIDIVASALHRFEKYTNFRDFRKFHIQQAIGFKAHLVKETNARTGTPLSKATLLTDRLAWREAAQQCQQHENRIFGAERRIAGLQQTATPQRIEIGADI